MIFILSLIEFKDIFDNKCLELIKNIYLKKKKQNKSNDIDVDTELNFCLFTNMRFFVCVNTKIIKIFSTQINRINTETIL